MEILITLLSVILGYSLGLFSELLKKKDEGREKYKSVRMLVNLETDNNKKLLLEYWRSVSQSNKEFYSDEGELNYTKIAYAINDVPFPRFSQAAWSKNLDSITSVYKSDELKILWETYERYETLNEIKEYLFILEQESTDAGDRATFGVHTSTRFIGGWVKSMHFTEKAENQSAKFKSLVDEIIAPEVVTFNKKSA